MTNYDRIKAMSVEEMAKAKWYLDKYLEIDKEQENEMPNI